MKKHIRTVNGMYKCNDCERTFEDDEIETVREDNGYDTEYTHIPYYEYVDRCPYCHSTDIEYFEEEEE